MSTLMSSVDIPSLRIVRCPSAFSVIQDRLPRGRHTVLQCQWGGRRIGPLG